MMVVVFRARRTPEGIGGEYKHWFNRMSELARTAAPDPAVPFAFRVGFGCAALVALLGSFCASRLRRIHV